MLNGPDLAGLLEKYPGTAELCAGISGGIRQTELCGLTAQEDCADVGLGEGQQP